MIVILASLDSVILTMVTRNTFAFLTGPFDNPVFDSWAFIERHAIA